MKRRFKTYEEYTNNFNFEDNLIFEGIDIDYNKKVVSVNLNHENSIDTGLTLNPSYTTIGGYDVISIFKRKYFQNNSGDGTLVYALKGIKGWKIDKKDIIKLLKQFISITNRISNNYDTIIKIPSSSKLNSLFLYRITNIIRCDNKIETLFKKLETEEDIFYICRFK